MATTPHEKAIEIAAMSESRNLNEADTRHQIIDEVLHEVLCWPRRLTKTKWSSVSL